MKALLGAVLAAVISVGAGAPQSAPAKRCFVDLLNVDRKARIDQMFNSPNNVMYDAAGHVRMQCRGQKVFLETDSISSLSGQYLRLYGHSAYRDTAYSLTADTIYYDLRLEKLEARGNVVATDKIAGSTLNGPYLDYWREVKGVNDSAIVWALKRPTVRFFNAPSARDTGKRSPYIMVGDNLKGFGQSRMTASGKVTIDRDSLHGEGDSLFYDKGPTSIARLLGGPALLRRRGSDSFVVFGKTIRVRSENDTVRDLRSFLDARVVRGTTDIAGDTIHLAFSASKLGLTLAWNRKSGATLHSGGYDIVGDSLAVDTPGEQLREIRIFRNGVLQNPLDTLVAAVPRVKGDTTPADTTRNRLSGERIVAHFDQVDSSGVRVTRVRSLQAIGRTPNQASSLFGRNEVGKDGKRSPSINYTLADTIFVRMKDGDSIGVASVEARGHVYGVQLETASVPKLKIDTLKAGLPAKGRP